MESFSQGGATSGEDWATGRCIPDDSSYHLGSDEKHYLEDEMEDYIASSDGSTFKERRYSFTNGLSGSSIAFRLELDGRSDSHLSGTELVVPQGILSLTIRHLKLVMEKEYSIPASSLSLFLKGCPLEDPWQLSHYKLRDGDSLMVTFEGAGDLGLMMDILESMKNACRLMKSLENFLHEGTVEKSMLTRFEHEDCMNLEDLSDNIFHSSTDDDGGNGSTNCHFLAESGGLSLMCILHEMLLKYPLSHLPLSLVAVETALLKSYWNISSDDSVFHRMAPSRVLRNISKSFLRMRIDGVSGVEVPVGLYSVNKSSWKTFCIELCLNSLGPICNFAEKDGYEVKVASNKAVMSQLVSFLGCSQQNDNFFHASAMGGILNLAFRSSTHQYLCSSSVMSGILKCRMSKLPQYFKIIMCGILLSTSPGLVNFENMVKILELFRDFFARNKVEEIRTLEVTFNFYWMSVIPYMKLAFHPHSRLLPRSAFEVPSVSQSKEFNRYCIQCGIFSLSNILCSGETRDVLVKEGLLDYLVCIPWLYPLHWPERKSASELVRFMRGHVTLRPPSLLSMVKAKLAGMYFGLEKVLRCEVNQLLTEVYL